MPKGRRNGKEAPGKRTETPRPMNKPAMMDWALRLLRLLNERKVLNSRIVAEEFDVNIRTAQRYLLYLSDLPCVVVDEEKHTYTLTSDYVITDKILNTSEMALVCALIDYATHIFGTEHSKFLAGLKNRIFRMDFREHIARWMPYFRVLEPVRYREFIQGLGAQVATRNEGLPV